MYFFSDSECCGGKTSCKSCGQIGFEFGEKYRSQLMFCAFWLSFVSFFLMFVVFCSTADNPRTVQNTAWIIGDLKGNSNFGNQTDIYMGLRYVVVDCSGDYCSPEANDFRWGSDECPQIQTASACNDCKKAADDTLTSAITGFITMIPQMSTNLQRSQAKGDLNCQKVMGMVTSFIGCITTLIALSDFLTQCYDNIPDSILGEDTNYRYGPSTICMFIVAIFKFLDFLFNLVVPVPEKGYWKDPENALMSPIINVEPSQITDEDDKIKA